MLTKLTLSIPKDLLVEAKSYSQRTHQPLSQLVSRYFAILARSLKRKKGSTDVTPTVKRVTGLAKSTKDDGELLFEALSSKHLR